MIFFYSFSDNNLLKVFGKKKYILKISNRKLILIFIASKTSPCVPDCFLHTGHALSYLPGDLFFWVSPLSQDFPRHSVLSWLEFMKTNNVIYLCHSRNGYNYFLKLEIEYLRILNFMSTLTL